MHLEKPSLANHIQDPTNQGYDVLIIVARVRLADAPVRVLSDAGDPISVARKLDSFVVGFSAPRPPRQAA